MVLRDASGIELASNSATFAVQSTAATGSGLTGTLVAAPRQVPLGDAAVLSLTARNQGNGALLGLPLTLRIVEPQAERVLAEFPETVDLAGRRLALRRAQLRRRARSARLTSACSRRWWARRR